MNPDLLKQANELGMKASAQTGVPFTPVQTAPVQTPINTVSATDLANPPKPVEIPQPKVSTQPAQFAQRFDGTVQQANDGIIRAQTLEAQQRDDLLSRLMGTETISSKGIYDQAFEAQGGGNALKQLQDASTKLAQLQGKFRTGAQTISGAQGQSQAFESVQLGELGRQEAIEVGNQALLVQALQGNVESARQIALDTSNFAIEDRKVEMQNLLAQLDAVGGIVAGQEAQLIQKEMRKLDTLQDAVNSAIQSGGASVEEMQQLTSANVSDEDKTALAQRITARTVASDRALQRQQVFEQMEARRQASLNALASGMLKGNDKTEAETEASLSTLAVIDSLKQAEGLSSAIGFGFGKSVIGAIPFVSGDAVAGTKRADFEAQANRLADMFLVQNLDKMTGVLTDKDLEVLRNEGTTIGNFNQSESAWLKELDRLENMMKRGVQEKGITPQQASFYYGIGDSELSEVQSIYGTDSSASFNPANFY
jgi:hypothetical protein